MKLPKLSATIRRNPSGKYFVSLLSEVYIFIFALIKGYLNYVFILNVLLY